MAGVLVHHLGSVSAEISSKVRLGRMNERMSVNSVFECVAKERYGRVRVSGCAGYGDKLQLLEK